MSNKSRTKNNLLQTKCCAFPLIQNSTGSELTGKDGKHDTFVDDTQRDLLFCCRIFSVIFLRVSKVYQVFMHFLKQSINSVKCEVCVPVLDFHQHTDKLLEVFSHLCGTTLQQRHPS